MNPQIDPIVRYIRYFRKRYTREAISNQLLARGNAQADIDQAWTIIESESPEPQFVAQSGDPSDVLLASQTDFDAIVKFIRRHRTRYTRPAIVSQLLDGGYTQPDIERAWTAVEAEDSTSKPHNENNAVFWASLLGFVVVTYLVPFLLLVAVGHSYSRDLDNVPWIALGLIQLSALIAGPALGDRNRPLVRGLRYGLLIADVVLPFIALVIIVGICVASGGLHGGI